MLSLLVGCAFLLGNSVVAIDHPEDFVNLLAGTFTDGNQFSTGNTLPLIGRPWGFNHWAPQTKPGNRYSGSWWFQGSDHQFTWMRCTHQPSPWIGDWGWFLFTPQIGRLERDPYFFWEPRGAVIKPHLFDATFSPHGIRIELAPSMHGAVMRVTFPPMEAPGMSAATEKRICFAEAEWTSHTLTPVPTLTGKSTQVKQDRMLISNFALHVRAVSESAVDVESHGDMTCFRYKPSAVVVTVRIATSLISQEQAEVNLNREVGLSRGFDSVAAEARADWNKMLRRVDVVDFGTLTESATRHLGVFYTGLARALSFPRRLDEVTAEGKVVHYSPYDPRGGVFDGPSVTDNGFWDTFRTVYPMLSLLYPDHLGGIIQGWLNAYKEGGWLPSWASPGYRNCMVGTFADVVVADAIVKGIKGFDLDTARDAILKDSFTEPPSLAGGAVGKEGLQEYISRGYFPNNNGDQVSRTLDFGFADYAVSKAFDRLASLLPESDSLLATSETKARREKLSADSKTLAARSKRAQTSLYDKAHGLMAPKDESGRTSSNFHEIEWGNGFVEGNAWHHSFPPYALENLAGLHGGSLKLLSKLHNLLDRPSDFMTGSYNQEIHEMTEARAFGMGQYSHNNQPVHHILYLFAELGDRATTETSVRKVMERGYGTDFYAGDEDNGEQGAWFVLSALGLFSTVPGSPLLVLGSPIFRHVRIWRGKCGAGVVECDYSDSSSGVTDAVDKSQKEGNTPHTFPVDSSYLDVVALGTSPTVCKVAEITFNGANLPPSDSGSSTLRRDSGPNMATVADSLLQRDGVLRFVMDGEKENGVLPGFIRSSSVASLSGSAEGPELLGQRSGGIPRQVVKNLQHGLENEKSQRRGAKRTYWMAPTFAPDPPDERMERKPLQSLQPRAVMAVTCLLLLIALVAVLVVDIFEFFTAVDKREKKEAHVV